MQNPDRSFAARVSKKIPLSFLGLIQNRAGLASLGNELVEFFRHGDEINA